jgi:hypothetical protein
VLDKIHPHTVSVSGQIGTLEKRTTPVSIFEYIHSHTREGNYLLSLNSAMGRSTLHVTNAACNKLIASHVHWIKLAQKHKNENKKKQKQETVLDGCFDYLNAPTVSATCHSKEKRKVATRARHEIYQRTLLTNIISCYWIEY